MANMIENILDDLVYVIPPTHSSLTTYPSPESLRGKIVIKGDGKLEAIHPQVEQSKKVEEIIE
jgi:hypothetical protein